MCSVPIPHFRNWNEQQQWAVRNLPRYWQNLQQVALSASDITSEHTPNYNCIAYAAEVYSIPWWPYLPSMPQAAYTDWPITPEWPPNVQNFISAFRTCGFEPCKNGKLQLGYEKVAIYVDGDKPQHMAREKGDGIWHSKLGGCQDIRHYTLEAVEDYCGYGKAEYFMRKRIPGTTRWQIRKRIAKILSGLKRSRAI